MAEQKHDLITLLRGIKENLAAAGLETAFTHMELPPMSDNLDMPAETTDDEMESLGYAPEVQADAINILKAFGKYEGL